MKVWIYSGIPGSGKTTLSKERHPKAYRVSADDFFLDKDGVYVFNPVNIGEAHAYCLRQFSTYVQDAFPEIVVDNTNTTAVEIAPYAALAQAYGYELEIVTVMCSPFEAAKRNVHGVPEQAVLRMFDNLCKRELPPWWPKSAASGGK